VQFGQMRAHSTKLGREIHPHRDDHIVGKQARAPKLALIHPLRSPVIIAEAGNQLAYR
jgi:hypothetical protein